MYRMSLLTLSAFALMLVSSAAWAHSTTAIDGTGSIIAGMDENPDGVVKVYSGCPGCGMAGGLCAGCKPTAEKILRDMSVGFCPNCEDPDNLCEMCEAGVNGALALLSDSFSPEVVEVPGHSMAYMAGTLMGDMDGLFGDLMSAAGQQGLLNENTQTGGIYPDALATGFSPDSTYYAAVSFPEGAAIAEPLQVFDIPGDNYLHVRHVGSYEELGASWMATFAWAKIAGVEFSTGPCGEHYVSNPETTPVEELITDIYIPLAATGEDAGTA